MFTLFRDGRAIWASATANACKQQAREISAATNEPQRFEIKDESGNLLMTAIRARGERMKWEEAT